MGLVSEMRWPQSRNGSAPHAAIHAAAALPPRPTEDLAVNDEYWAALMLRVSALVIIVFQLAYLLSDLDSGNYGPATLGLHLFNIFFTCLTLGVSFSAGMMRYWREVVLAMCAAVIGGTVGINVIGNEDIPLFIVALLFATGSGCLIPWNERWQAALNVVALGAFAIDEALISAHDPYLYFRWLGMLTGVAIAQLAAHLTGIYRRGLAARYEALAHSERRLRDEVAYREQAQAEARERAETLKRIFETSPDIITVSSRRDSRLIEANDAFYHDTSHHAERFAGKPAYLLRTWANPAQREQFEATLAKDGVVRNFEAALVVNGGRTDSYLVSSAAVELQGEPCLVSIARNVTELKRTERRTAISEAKLRKIFESTSDAIAIFSLVDGHLIEVNSEFTRVTGYSREEALAAASGKLPIWENDGQRRRFLRELRAHGALHNLEGRVRNRNGTISPFLISGSIVELDGERCAIAIMRDITALKHTQDELVAAREQALGASHAKSEFLSSMSHEIRTPMNAILGMAEVLWETNLDGDQRRYLDTMRSNGGTLLGLLDDILDLAKVESGRLRLEEVEFDLGDLVEKTAETLAVRAHGKGLELVARVAPGTPARLMGDPLRLRQVLMNLLGNAIKFTELGEVVLTAEGEDSAGKDLVRFSVADTGIGIEPRELDAIFSDFTQADSSNTRKYGGSGLGLAIASRLVSLLGGRIWVESAPGIGSTFHFTARLKAADRMSEPAPAYDLKGLRALVADRNATNRRIFVETLGSCGATVEEAATVQETITALGEALRLDRPFDVVFGDCQMPGIEQIERLAKDGCTCGAGMIIPMLTTDDLRSKLARLSGLGFQSHLLKPVRRSDLLEVISHAARRLKDPAESAPAPRGTALTSAPSAPPSRPIAATATVRQPLRILLAEDSPDNRLLIVAYFKRLPYQVETAENGKVAIEKFISGRYDLVLMDLQMPEMDGYAAARVIRSWEAEHDLPATPILALTASTLNDDIRRAFEAGCNTHVAKPVRKATLLEAIERTLTLARAAAAKAAPGRSPSRIAGTSASH